MSHILILEPDEKYRFLLRYILEGINHRVSETGTVAGLPMLLTEGPPDLLVLGIHLEGDFGFDEPRAPQGKLPEAPTLILFSGDDSRQREFLEQWGGFPAVKFMVQPVEPYRFMAMIKAMLTAPAVWRQGGQHVM